METYPWLLAGMALTFFGLLGTGFPIAWVLGGTAVLFGCIGWACDVFLGTFTRLNWTTSMTFVRDISGNLLENDILVAIPLFIFMGLMLDKSGLAERMMQSMQELFGRLRGGLAISVTLIGIILAASTGIVGASVVLLGLLGLPIMLRQGYDKGLAAGTIASAGTLGILMPPSIMLVIMADRTDLSVDHLFKGALIPAMLLGSLYLGYLVFRGLSKPDDAPLPAERQGLHAALLGRVLADILPAAGLIVVVLGSIFAGLATTTQAAGVGALGAMLLAITRTLLLRRRATADQPAPSVFRILHDANVATMQTVGYVFAIFVGALCFSYVFQRLGGYQLIETSIASMEASLGGHAVVAIVLLFIFLLGFFLDWIEITLIFLPLLAAAMHRLDLGISAEHLDKPGLIWFTILVALCLQTSFLTPPVGFSLFFLKGVAPPEMRMADIYRGVVPFIILQVIAVVMVALFPALVLWLADVPAPGQR